ncbi:MAG: OadG family protein [Chloroflexi bacterium]|nr:OadG family protein [Chloroflexota bacterium]
MSTDLQFGLLLMFYGMGLVFIILALLWGVIALFQQIDRRLSPDERPQPQPRAAADDAAAPTPDVLAAIMVAVHRYRQESQQPASEPPPAPQLTQSPGRWVAVGRARQLSPHVFARRRGQS